MWFDLLKKSLLIKHFMSNTIIEKMLALKDLTLYILPHIVVYWNSFRDNRDNIYIDYVRGSFEFLMENQGYDCVGNETVIYDCPRYYEGCPSTRDFFGRTELRCKGNCHHVLNYQ